MVNVLGPWRRFALAIRIARRGVRADLGQSILIVFLMVVPLASVATFLTVVESQIPTPNEAVTMRMGQSEAALLVVSPPDKSLIQNPIDADTWQVETESDTGERLHSDRSDPRVDPVSVLPVGTRILPVTDKGMLVVETATGRGAVRYVEGEVWDPALEGAFSLEAGRAPETAGEVVVTASVLERLRKQLGDELVSFEPATTFTIVGVVDEAMQPDAVNTVYASPGAPSGPGATRYFVPDLVLSWAQVTDLNTSGITVWSRQVILNPPDDVNPLYNGQQGVGGTLALIIVFGVIEICVLAGAAFHVGARREQRTLALLSSSGAERGTLIQTVTARGVVLGAVASVLGSAIGVGVAWVYTQFIDDGDAAMLPGFHVPWTMLMIAVLLTVVTGWIAAIIPAVIASRVDVMAALRGASRPVLTRVRSLRAGIALVAAGTAIAGAAIAVLASTNWGTLSDVSADENLVVIVTIVLIIVGAVFIATGLLLALGRLLAGIAHVAAETRLPMRLALRDLARNTGRTVPVVAVILATVSIAVFVMSTQAYQQTIASTYRVLPGLPGQATMAIFSAATYDGAPTLTPAQARAAAADLTVVAEGRFQPESIHTLQRPWQDWTAWSAGTDGYELVLPQQDAEQLCPGGGSSGHAIDPSDPRCDLRNNPVHLNGTGPGVPSILLGDAGGLAIISGVPTTAEQRATLDGGGAIAFWPQLINSDGNADLAWTRFEPGQSADVIRTKQLPATLIETPERLAYGLFMTPTTAEELGLTPVDALLIIDLVAEPGTAVLDAANAEFAAAFPGAPFVEVVHDPADEGRHFQWIVLGLVLLATLSAAAIAVGLGRIDGRRDEFTLWSVGADPTHIRLIAGLQAGTQTLLAVVFGVIIGLIPGYGIWGSPVTGINMAPPWLHLGIMLIGLPIIFGLGAALAPARTTRGGDGRRVLP